MSLAHLLRTESERTLAVVQHRLGRNALRFICETHLELPPHPPPDRRILLLFAHYDLQGIVDPYVAYYLKALHGLGATIVSSPVRPPCRTSRSLPSAPSVRAFTPAARCPSTSGRGISRGASSGSAAGHSIRFDQFVIANYGCLGPLFPLEEMWSSFRGADMYGAIENTQLASRISNPFFSRGILNRAPGPSSTIFGMAFSTRSTKEPSSGGPKSA